MPERMIHANGIEICCEDFGSPANPALLLVMGAGGQAILWPEEFCAELASAGFYVIRYDNRDVGRSSCFDFARQPYTLSDMARDAVGVLDAFGIARAHVVGASMGGMIGQTLALEHAPRVRTLSSVMSSPFGARVSALMGSPGGGELAPHPRLLAAFAQQLARPPRTPDERIDAAVALWRARSRGGVSRLTKRRSALAKPAFSRAPATSTRRRTTGSRSRLRRTGSKRCAGCAFRRSSSTATTIRSCRSPTVASPRKRSQVRAS